MAGKSDRPSAIVVGAGVGGVSTAARLAKAGFYVTVFEKNDFTGGRCSLIHHEGYRFDQGPSLLLLPHLFEEAFNDLGTSIEGEGIELLKCEPNYNVWFSDGDRFQLSTDLAQMKAEVERVEGKDGFERYLGFLQETHRHYELSVTHVLRKNFTSFFSMARPSFLRHIIDMHPLQSMYSRASLYFKTDRLRRVFTFASMYMGMSPFNAPGTYSLLQYTELAEGIWYPVGGFHRIIDGLVAVGERLGVKYRLNTAVESVTVDPKTKRATGVTLASGEHVSADVVVVNADLVYAMKNLLPPSARADRLAKKPASCSSISFYWALKRKFPELETHNIFLAEEYRESFDAIFERFDMPEQLSFYVNVPSRVDPTAAPPDGDSVVVLVPVGHLQGEDKAGVDAPNLQDWDTMVARAREFVLSTVEARTGARGLKEAIVEEQVNTPVTWREKFNLDRGAILGLSHSFFNVLSFRPSTRCPDVKRCFFVGSSTHPGAGMPICLAGGKLTSEQVLDEFGMDKPWVQGGQQGKSLQQGLVNQWRNVPVVGWIVALLLLLMAVYFGQ